MDSQRAMRETIGIIVIRQITLQFAVVLAVQLMHAKNLRMVILWQKKDRVVGSTLAHLTQAQYLQAIAHMAISELALM